MARFETTLLSLISTRAAKALSLLAAVLLLSALAPAVALAEGPWAEEKLQQLYEAYTSAQAEYEAAKMELDAADEALALARENWSAADSDHRAFQEAFNQLESLMREAQAAYDAGHETDAQMEDINDILDEARLYAAILGIPEEEIKIGVDVLQYHGIVDAAYAAARQADDKRIAAERARDALVPILAEAEEKYEAAEDAYMRYKELPAIALTFDLGGGTLGSETGTITRMTKVGDVVGLPDAPTLEGYTFKFWKGSEYAAGAEYTVEGEHAFAAEWEQNASSDEKSDSDKSGSDAKSKIPATGDDMSKVVIPLSVAAGVALIALIGAAIKRRRGKN